VIELHGRIYRSPVELRLRQAVNGTGQDVRAAGVDCRGNSVRLGREGGPNKNKAG